MKTKFYEKIFKDENWSEPKFLIHQLKKSNIEPTIALLKLNIECKLFFGNFEKFLKTNNFVIVFAFVHIFLSISKHKSK